MPALTLSQTESIVTVGMASLADGSGRKGNVFDFGVDRAPLGAIRVKYKPGSTPTAGRALLVFGAWSNTDTSGSYSGGLSGGDAAFTVRNELAQLDPIDVIPCDADTNTHQALFEFRTLARYFMPVLWNDLGVALSGTAGDHEVGIAPVDHNTSG